MGLPPNDPLRYDENGRELTADELEDKLQLIIDSWPVEPFFSGAFRPPEPEKATVSRTRLSQPETNDVERKRKWLSR